MKTYTRHSAPAFARLLCLALACALGAPTQLAAGQSIRPRGVAPAMRIVRQSSPPAADLPDLDAIR